MNNNSQETLTWENEKIDAKIKNVLKNIIEDNDKITFEESTKQGYIPYSVGSSKHVWYITIDGQYNFIIAEIENGTIEIWEDKNFITTNGIQLGELIDSKQVYLQEFGGKYIIPFAKMKVIHTLDEAKQYWYEEIEADFKRACEEEIKNTTQTNVNLYIGPKW